ncbi:MAG: hypothetical protein JNL82_34440 [Myxococcales bacterium]|nr:hypothetical protein [Myxococcales bacterium]
MLGSGGFGRLFGCLLAGLVACGDNNAQTGEPPADGTSTGELTTGVQPTTGEPDPGTTTTGAPQSLCGDGVRDPGEACDDGNVDNTDNCLEDCTLAVCGDGFVQAGLEQCDDANGADDDSCVPGCYAATCGDGYLYVGEEQCDDGNKVDDDECTNSCTVGAPPQPVCGNGELEPGEQCDDGNTDSDDNCVEGCVPWSCGDGWVHGVFETCDDANLDNHDDCVDVGGACLTATCGDGYLHDGVEQCDDGNPSNSDDCLADCTPAFCGDGFLHAGEEVCDFTKNDGDYGGCNPDCQALGPSCGDGNVDAGHETCDDGNTMAGDGCDEACQSELPPECLDAIPLMEMERAVAFNDGPGKITKCDTKTDNKWHRFLLPAGTVMPMAPPTQYSCGTDSPGWMMGTLPLPDEGAVARTACFVWEGDPCTWSTEIEVLNCGGEYYVYRLASPPEVCLRYCAAPG